MVQTEKKSWNTATAESFNHRMFSLSGRLNRLSFFTRIIFVQIGGTILIMAIILLGMILPLPLIGLIFMALIIIVAISQVIATFALMVRRLHDMGFNGSWVVIFLVCNVVASFDDAIRAGEIGDASLISILALGVSLVFFLVLLFWPGEEGRNDYGPDPLQGGIMANIDKTAENTPFISGRRPNDPLPPVRRPQVSEQDQTSAASRIPASRQTSSSASINKVPSGSGRGTKLKVVRKD